MTTATRKPKKTTLRDDLTGRDSRWSGRPIAIYADSDSPANEDLRRTILADAYRFSAYGVERRRVILRTPAGLTLCTPQEDAGGAPLVRFEHLPEGAGRRVEFWMHAPKVADLGDRMRERQDRRRPFADVLAGH